MAANNSINEYLFTKYILLNQVTLASLIDLKDGLIKEDKQMYNFFRTKINKLISEQQAMHDACRLSIPKDDIGIWKVLEEINSITDKILLK